MRPWKLALGGTLAAALAMVPLSSASADWYYHGPYNNYGPYSYYGPPAGPFGVVGAVLGGAATIATAPLAFFGAGPAYGPAYYGGSGYYGGDYNDGSYYGGDDYDGGYGYSPPAPDYDPGYAQDVYGAPAYGPCPDGYGPY